jgi:hypothetical protein
MATAFQWSNAELARVYSAAYQGRIARLCAAQATTGLTVNSTTAQWDAAEITSQAANGYARVQWTLPAGSYNNALLRYQTTTNTATFQASASGLGLMYDTIYLVFGTQSGSTVTWDTNVGAIYTHNPTIALAPGQPLAYKVFLICDDVTTL